MNRFIPVEEFSYLENARFFYNQRRSVGRATRNAVGEDVLKAFVCQTGKKRKDANLADLYRAVETAEREFFEAKQLRRLVRE